MNVPGESRPVHQQASELARARRAARNASGARGATCGRRATGVMLASVRGKLGVISMDAQFLLQLVQAAVVVIGVGFAAYELRKYREERNREAALELVHTFQTPEFAKALLIVCELPDGLSKAEIEAHVRRGFLPASTAW